MIFIALLATLCGAKYCTDIALFGREKEGLLRTILELKNGIPSHDTFSRVFRLLDPKSFEKVFRRFMKMFAETVKIDGVVALDGKALRRAYQRGKSHMPPVMVTAWSASTRMALANTLAPGNNEAAGALELIELLCLKGCVVTMDALHCRRDAAQAIVARGGDYVLAVKANQPGLLRSAKAAIAQAERAQARKVRPATPPMAARKSAPPSLLRQRSWPNSTTSRASWRSPGSRASAAATRPSSATSCSPALQAGKASQHRAPALEHREHLALDARCRPRRGSGQKPQGQRSGESRRAQTLRPQYRETRNQVRFMRVPAACLRTFASASRVGPTSPGAGSSTRRICRRRKS